MPQELPSWDTNMPQPRVAVIGAGSFGQNHCRVVHESERAQLAAIVDTDPARAAEAAARYGAVALTDARELAGQGGRGDHRGADHRSL